MKVKTLKFGPTPGDKFELVLFRLSQQVSFAREHMRIARGISKAATDNLRSLQCAQVFFAFTFRAHLESAYAGAARLFDPQSRAATIPSVLRTAEHKAGEFRFAKPAEVRRKIRDWKTRIESTQPVLTKLHNLRNRLISHLDREVILDPEVMSRTVSVTFDEIEKVFHVANEILNSALDAYINSRYTHDLPSPSDFEQLLRILEKSDSPNSPAK